MSTAPWIFLFLACFLPASAAPAPQPLEKLENCTFVPTDWADGDSFRIKTVKGEEHTLRLYGADCIEWHVNDPTDERRLRAQRSYFGITNASPNVRESIEIAKDFGKAAANEVVHALEKPFTVHTTFRNGNGDGKHPRIYAFVTTSTGADLASELVSKGLARAFGVCNPTPDGRTTDDYRELLVDLELQTAKRGTGIWARTDWNKLPNERQDQRRDDELVNLAIAKHLPPANFKLNPNKAARDDLMKIPGIGEEMANRIIDKQPYEKPEDLLEVTGIGPKKLEVIRPFLEFSRP
jgi:endonuclease YncB( thermonuclease family)